MSDEGPRDGASRDRMQKRRLDLQEPALLHERADRGVGSCPRVHGHARLRVHDEIEVALAMARLDVRHPVPLLGHGPLAGGQDDHRRDADRQLSPAGHQHGPLGPHDVADVDVLEARHTLVADHVLACEQLHAAGLILEVGECGLSVAADAPDASRDPDPSPGLDPGLEICVPIPQLSYVVRSFVGVRELHLSVSLCVPVVDQP